LVEGQLGFLADVKCLPCEQRRSVALLCRILGLCYLKPTPRQ
jgi:hypothetical protein